MSEVTAVPRVLVVDDLFGRDVLVGPNEDRENLCGELLLEDVTDDHACRASRQVIERPLAQAMFCRGQLPAAGATGDVVENDLDGIVRVVRQGWLDRHPGVPPWALVLLDLCFYTGRITRDSHASVPGMPEGRPGDDASDTYFGLQVLQRLRREFPELPVAVLSSRPRDEVSRKYSELGAVGFIPRGETETADLLRDYLWRHGLTPDPAQRIVGTSIGLLLALRAARRYAASGRHVLLTGEPGTGKELFARYIHGLEGPAGNWCLDSPRPFVAVDSGALSPDLYASMLFGHTRDAFTGATRERQGWVQLADGGDLFLDEVGNMPTDVQIGLMRVLQEGEVVKLGSDKGTRVNVRVLSATNQDLERRVTEGKIGRDLVDRLRLGGTVALPPLRQRSDDIPLLAESFLAQALTTYTHSRMRHIDPATMKVLRDYDWPGNVRALQTAIYQAVAENSDVEFLSPVHFEAILGPSRSSPAASIGREDRGANEPRPISSSGELASLLIAALFSELSPPVPGDLDFAASKLLIRRHLSRLVQAGKLAVPSGVGVEDFFGETWALLRMDLRMSHVRWMAGRLPAFQNPARRVNELTRMAVEATSIEIDSQLTGVKRAARAK